MLDLVLCILGENVNYLLTLTRPPLVMNEAHFMQMVRWGKEAANLQLGFSGNLSNGLKMCISGEAHLLQSIIIDSWWTMYSRGAFFA